MNYVPEFSAYMAYPDECYISLGTFEETKTFLEALSKLPKKDDENFYLDEDILIIEIEDGVFIRSKSADWSIRLTRITENPYDGMPALKIIRQKDWDRLTSKVKYPINSFGDEKLVRWKMGF